MNANKSKRTGKKKIALFDLEICGKKRATSKHMEWRTLNLNRVFYQSASSGRQENNSEHLATVTVCGDRNEGMGRV
jgi:hypothetical protein